MAKTRQFAWVRKAPTLHITFINDAGEVDGFEREVGDELCKRAELTCDGSRTTGIQIIPNLVSGNYDTIIAGMSITDERDEVIDFTQDYFPPTDSGLCRDRRRS